MKKLHAILIIAIALLTGCATQPPLPLSQHPVAQLTVAEVQSDPAQFKGREVRWGGTIVKVDNQPSQTWVEIAGQPLWDNGEPQAKSSSHGRFIASFAGFADPMVYSSGRLLTVVGQVTDVTTRPIGEYNYTFPVITVGGAHLWPIEQETSVSDDRVPLWWYYETWPFYPRRHRYPHPFYLH